jgi:hypothetical protein
VGSIFFQVTAISRVFFVVIFVFLGWLTHFFSCDSLNSLNSLSSLSSLGSFDYGREFFFLSGLYFLLSGSFSFYQFQKQDFQKQHLQKQSAEKEQFPSQRQSFLDPDLFHETQSRPLFLKIKPLAGCILGVTFMILGLDLLLKSHGIFLIFGWSFIVLHNGVSGYSKMKLESLLSVFSFKSLSSVLSWCLWFGFFFSMGLSFCLL